MMVTRWLTNDPPSINEDTYSFLHGQPILECQERSTLSFICIKSFKDVGRILFV